ncbi:Tox-REase-5 domain-containing protein [Pyxidicoccus caerfyrddinensis]|uniref:Tox-REase-5 domain-containing protein n=1 Tax=Pyxidicoccus caerfyrddinensis TaxID=2709663 RepID=UPI0013D97F31|nr:Tox-REase-5 domain-containing protein [Pyxidicoccus caerfyrddinensis]
MANSVGPARLAAVNLDAFEQLLVAAGLDSANALPPRGEGLTPDGAARLLAVLLTRPVTLDAFPPRLAASHLLREVLASGEVSREELLRRVERFANVAVLRPDGCLAWVRSGRTQQRVEPVQWNDGCFRAGPFELGRFYSGKGGAFRVLDDRLKDAGGGALAEVYDDADYLGRSLDGAEEAFVELVAALGQLLTYPTDSVVGLRSLPAGLAALVASSPEYLARFRHMTRGEQVKALSKLTTNLIATWGAASGVTRTLTGALRGAEATVPVLSLSAEGALVMERISLPVGQAATVLGGGPGAAIILQQTNMGGGGGTASSGGPGEWKAAKEYMKEPAREYQAQVSQAPKGQVYVIDDVDFDGFKNGVLLEAKGPGYSEFIPNAAENGGWFQGFREIVNQARRQSRAARGTPLQWHFAEREVADFVRALFRKEGLGAIKVVHTPPAP